MASRFGVWNHDFLIRKRLVNPFICLARQFTSLASVAFLCECLAFYRISYTEGHSSHFLKFYEICLARFLQIVPCLTICKTKQEYLYFHEIVGNFIILSSKRILVTIARHLGDSFLAGFRTPNVWQLSTSCKPSSIQHTRLSCSLLNVSLNLTIHCYHSP